MDLTRKEYRLPIARRMAELRELAGRTQQDCADALGVAQNTYAQMETGEIRFRRRDLVTLAYLHGLPLDKAFPAFTDQLAAAA